MKKRRPLNTSGCLYVFGFFSGLLFIVVCGSSSLVRNQPTGMQAQDNLAGGRLSSVTVQSSPVPSEAFGGSAGDLDVAIMPEGSTYYVSIIALGFEAYENVQISLRAGEQTIVPAFSTTASEIGSISFEFPYPDEAKELSDVMVVVAGSIRIEGPLPPYSVLPPFETAVVASPPTVTTSPNPPLVRQVEPTRPICTETPRPPSPTPIPPSRTPTFTPSPTPIPQEVYFPNWRGEYFNTISVIPGKPGGEPVLVRDDVLIAFNWHEHSPAPGDIAENWYSALWTRRFFELEEGYYDFVLSADDHAVVRLDGRKLFGYVGTTSRPNRTSLYLQGAMHHDFEISYNEYWGSAGIHFYWEKPTSRCCWNVACYQNAQFFGEPFEYQTLEDEDLRLNWRTLQDLSSDKITEDQPFSLHITRQYQAPDQAGDYYVCLYVNDNAKMWLDHTILIDRCECSSRACLLCKKTHLDKAPLHELSIEYSHTSEEVLLGFFPVRVKETEPWIGAFFDNPTLSGLPVYVQTAPENGKLVFNWGNQSPDPRLPADNFSIHWIRSMSLSHGVHQFNIYADDGVRLWIDDKSVLNAWEVGVHQQTVTYEVFGEQETVNLKFDYFEAGGQAALHFEWIPPVPTCTPTPIITPVPIISPTPSNTPTIPPFITPMPPCVTATPCCVTPVPCCQPDP